MDEYLWWYVFYEQGKYVNNTMPGSYTFDKYGEASTLPYYGVVGLGQPKLEDMRRSYVYMWAEYNGATPMITFTYHL